MRFLVFDCESIGLHGETFAVGWVVLESGQIVEEGLFHCSPDAADGPPEARAWVKANVPPLPLAEGQRGVELLEPADVRLAFWQAWERFKERDGYLAADVPWPVEARFLAACVDDALGERAWQGPYPLIDIASVRLAAGFDPLGTVDRLPNELPAHDPLADARQSARLLFETLILSESAL